MTALKIAFAYIRHHFLRFVVVIFSCALMISSIFFTQIFASANRYTEFYNNNKDTVQFRNILYGVDTSMINDEVLSDFCAGLMYISGYTQNADNKQYIAYMDDRTRKSLGVLILRGKMPAAENEIAAGYSALQGLGADVGDSITLNITDKSGSHVQEFTITGMTSDFYENYQNCNVYIAADGDDAEKYITFPQIITGAASADSMSCNMVIGIQDLMNYPDGRPMFFGQDVLALNTNAVGTYDDMPTSESILRNVIIAVVVPIFVIIAMFAGVYASVRILTDGQKNNIALLRTIGADGFQTFGVFMWQALFISFCSCALSTACGFVITLIYGQVMESKGMLFSVPVTMYVTIALLSFAALMLFYLFHFMIMCRDDRNRRIKPIKRDIPLGRLWRKTTGRQSFGAKMAFSVIISAFTLIFTVGMLWGDIASCRYYNAINNSDNYAGDYFIRVPGGTTEYDVFSYDLPSGCGFDSQTLDGFCEKYQLVEKFKAEHISFNSYIVLEKGESVPDGFGERFTINESNKALGENAGYSIGQTLVKCKIKAIPYKYLSYFFGNVDFSEEEYNSGKRIISANSAISKGDSYKVSFLCYSNAAKRLDDFLKEKPENYMVDMTVTDKLSINKDNLKSELYEYAMSMDSAIIVSDEYLKSYGDFLRYDYIILDNGRELSESDAFAVDDELFMESRSRNVYMYNRSIYPLLMKKEANEQRMPFAVVSALYIVIAALFGYINISSEIKCKIKSIAVLKAIGADRKILLYLFVTGALKKTLPGIIAGGILCTAATVYLNFTSDGAVISYVSVLNPILYFAAAVLIMLLITAVSAVVAVYGTDKNDIYSSLTKEIF